METQGTPGTHYRRRQAVWGLALIAAGTLFYLDQVDILSIADIWHYWPLLVILSGLGKIIGYRTGSDVVSGVWMICIGAWLYANIEGLFGLEFRSSWPLLVIGWGVTLLLTPFVTRRLGTSKEHQHEY